MDAFVRRLVERLLDDSQPLSRNRHFHTFETPEGKRALRISRRLLALDRDVRVCRQQGGHTLISRQTTNSGEVKIEIRLEHLKTSRSTTLERGEFELLAQLPAVSALLDELRHGDERIKLR